MTQNELEKLIEKIDDLIVQATKERSHYYTASVLKECRKCMERYQDTEEVYQKVMDEKCAKDEIHCTCVPFLRRRIAEIERARIIEQGGWEEVKKYQDKIDELKKTMPKGHVVKNCACKKCRKTMFGGKQSEGIFND